MQIHLINLARDIDRLRDFHRRNPHIRDIVRSPAVDGRSLDKAKLVEDGLMAADLNYTLGALGNAASHIVNWRMAANQNKFINIVEDDAILSDKFDVHAQRILTVLPADWDIILWGWNFDAPSYIDMLPGVCGAAIDCSQDEMRSNIERFQRLKTFPVPVRLLHAFGTMCYSVSPKGAQALIDICLPLRPQLIDFPGFGWQVENTTIDVMMNAAYPSLEAFVCLPPLVVSENRHETSTIVGKP